MDAARERQSSFELIQMPARPRQIVAPAAKASASRAASVSPRGHFHRKRRGGRITWQRLNAGEARHSSRNPSTSKIRMPSIPPASFLSSHRRWPPFSTKIQSPSDPRTKQQSPGPGILDESIELERGPAWRIQSWGEGGEKTERTSGT